MTVRTWFTISALVLVALSVAIVVRLLAPVGVPGMLARAEDVRLKGVLVKGCWPQRNDELRCEEGNDARAIADEVASEGRIHVTVAYPAEPDTGSIVIRDEDNEVVVREEFEEGDWTGDLDYELDEGTYEMTSEARYPLDAYVRYAWRFTVRR